MKVKISPRHTIPYRQAQKDKLTNINIFLLSVRNSNGLMRVDSVNNSKIPKRICHILHTHTQGKGDAY